MFVCLTNLKALRGKSYFPHSIDCDFLFGNENWCNELDIFSDFIFKLKGRSTYLDVDVNNITSVIV